MRAVILAGGKGARLAPYTTVIPKPLLPIGDQPILEVVVRQLAAAGFDHITLSLGYMSDYFKVFLAHHRNLRKLMRIDFIEEEQPTGTAGSLAAVPDLKGTFLVMNGDILTSLNYRELLNFHHQQQSVVTIATHNKTVRIDLGILKIQDDAIIDYIEKPTMKYPVSMGIYIYNERALNFIKPGEYLDFPDLVLRLIRSGEKVSGFQTDCTWLDLGRYEDFQEASKIFEEKRHMFVPDFTPATEAA